MKNLAHELIIAVQFLLGKIARSPHTPGKFRKAAETGFSQLNKLRFKIGSHGGDSKMKLDDSKAGRSPDKQENLPPASCSLGNADYFPDFRYQPHSS